MISTYASAEKYMSKARNKSAGRAMVNNHWRMHQDGNEYVVNVRRIQIGRFLPDNTFMFSLTGGSARRIAQTISVTLDRNLPFAWKRCGPAMYRVDHRSNIDSPWWEHFKAPTSAPQLYDGLRFDLSTGKCLNHKPDITKRIVPERRKEWLAASGAWKRKLKAASRLGVFDGLIAAELANRTPWNERVRWDSKQGIDILYKAIKDNDCSVALLRMFVASATVSWVGSSPQVYAYIEKTISKQSIALRKRFGVFEGE